MADVVFSIAKGRTHELLRSAGGARDLRLVILKTAEADATLVDRVDLGAVLAAAGTAEATFTNYARKLTANASVAITIDNANNRVDIDIPDVTWLAAGGGGETAQAKLVLCADGASDALRIPLVALDFPVVPDGSDVTAVFNAAGFYRAA